jgi:hypothetical protein
VFISLVQRETVSVSICARTDTGNHGLGCRDLKKCTNISKGKMCQKLDKTAEDLTADCPALVNE